jgi:DNA-binding winged helix-turn-helix (wHTH) protein
MLGGVRTVQLQDNIRVGDLEVRPNERAVLVQGHEVPLTPGEFEIVMMLAEHPRWVYSADQLSSEPEEGHSPESISVLVSRLRQKLAAAGASDAIETVRGFGYRLHALDSPDGVASGAGEASRTLRDALWQLQATVIEVEHSGTLEVQSAATEALDQARHAIYAKLAE